MYHSWLQLMTTRSLMLVASGYYNILFAHPEAFISCKFGRELANNPGYQKNVCSIVIDEAHCVLEW